jgi:hydroxyethylthiazole kinase-like uncharacterized protein yjeF
LCNFGVHPKNMQDLPNDIFPGENVASVKAFLQASATGYQFVDEAVIKAALRFRDPAAHKGTFGHTLIIAGSEGKSGAAILCCKAALRSGCGLLTAWVPPAAQVALLSSLPEAMTIVRESHAAKTFPPFDNFSATGFGPGVGMDAGPILAALLENTTQPVVIDADGLTLLSYAKTSCRLLSPRIILTPHAREFDRLTKDHRTPFERLQSQLQFSRDHNVLVLLKGRYTSVTTPAGKIYFNTTGNDGMATAGSGDVLTGIISSLLAQGYAPETAAFLGAYLHGYAGDAAAKIHSKTSMIASDIIEGVEAFFKEFENLKI